MSRLPSLLVTPYHSGETPQVGQGTGVTNVTSDFVQLYHNGRLKTSGFDRTMLLRRANEEGAVSDLHTTDITAGDEFLESPGRFSDSSRDSINDASGPQHWTPFTIHSPPISRNSDYSSDEGHHGYITDASCEQLPNTTSNSTA